MIRIPNLDNSGGGADRDPIVWRVPPRRQIIIATIGALVVAALLLLCVVLPAEYGIDPLATGRALGLLTLSETRTAVVSKQTGDYKADSVEFVLGSYQAIEYKYRLPRGAGMLFTWQASNPVVFDFHGEPDGKGPTAAQSFDRRQAAEAAGTFVAPFAGVHGWYWENAARGDVRIRLTTAGFYEGAQEFFDGDVIDHPLKWGGPARASPGAPIPKP